VVEETGSVPLENADFTLTARPDRIDLLTDARVHIYDYKTGSPPTTKQQKAYDKQLLLEAAMAERGAFAALGKAEVAAVSYLQLGGEAKEERIETTSEIADDVWRGLERLISAYFDRQKGYTARRAVFTTQWPGDYDHLSRFGEWSTETPATPEDVG
jgi:RecB family exonuclease